MSGPMTKKEKRARRARKKIRRILLLVAVLVGILLVTVFCWLQYGARAGVIGLGAATVFAGLVAVAATEEVLIKEHLSFTSSWSAGVFFLGLFLTIAEVFMVIALHFDKILLQAAVVFLGILILFFGIALMPFFQGPGDNDPPPLVDKKKEEPKPPADKVDPSLPKGWLILFRSHDPSIWNSDTRR